MLHNEILETSYRRTSLTNPASEAVKGPVVQKEPEGDGVRLLSENTSRVEPTAAPNKNSLPHVVEPTSPLQRARYLHHEVTTRLAVLQSWEGTVLNVDRDGGTFSALLCDLENPQTDNAEAVFDLADVSSNDHDLLRPGGVFRWMIGYRRYRFGQQERVSALVFRRLPMWTEADIADAVREGEAIAGAIPIE